jgi:hypothetical protein
VIWILIGSITYAFQTRPGKLLSANLRIHLPWFYEYNVQIVNNCMFRAMESVRFSSIYFLAGN